MCAVVNSSVRAGKVRMIIGSLADFEQRDCRYFNPNQFVMFRLVINPSALRCVQPSLAVRSFVSTSFSRLPAKPALPTSITAKTGSGRGGKVDKVAAAEAKALRLELKAAKAALAKVKADDKLIKTQAAKASGTISRCV